MAGARLAKTRHSGVYKRIGKTGDKYVVIWTHRGTQHKETFDTLTAALEGKGKRGGGEKRATSKEGFVAYYERWIVSYAGRTSRGFSSTTRPEYERPIK